MKPRQLRKETARSRTTETIWTKRSWLIGLALVLVILAILLVVGRASVTVKGELRVRRVSFASESLDSERFFNRIVTPQLTLERFATLQVGRGRLEEVEASSSSQQNAGTLQSPADMTLTPVDPTSATVTVEQVTVNQLALPKRATLILSVPDSQATGSLQLEVQAARNEDAVVGKLAAAFNPLLIACRECTTAKGDTNETRVHSWRFHAEPGQEVRFQGSATGLTMRFVLDPDEPFVERDLPVDRALEFVQVVGERGESTILGGTVEISEMQSKVVINAREVLKLGDFSAFRLATVRIDQGIVLEFAGRVGEFRLGPAGFVENRLPRYIEVLYNRLPWIVWSFFGALIGLMREIWKTLKEGKQKPA